MSVHVGSVVVWLQSYSAEPVDFINTPGPSCELVCGGGDAPSTRCQVLSNIGIVCVCVCVCGGASYVSDYEKSLCFVWSMFDTLFSLISHIVYCALLSENLTKILAIDYWAVDRGSNSDFF